MKIRAIFFVGFLFLALGILTAQKQKASFYIHPNDTAALRALVLHDEFFFDTYPDSLMRLSHLAIQIINENKNPPKQIIQSLMRIKALAYHNLGLVYDGYGDKVKAIYNYETGLKIAESINDTASIAFAINDMAQVYEANGDEPSALKYYNISLSLVRLSGDKLGESDALNNVAHLYERRNSFDTAMAFYNQSLDLRTLLHDTLGIAMSLNNIGTVYYRMGNYDMAEKYFRQSIPLRKLANDIGGMAASLTNLAYLLMKRGHFSKAIETGNEAMLFSKQTGQLSKIASASKILYFIHKEAGNSELAFRNYQTYIKLHDSINTFENRKAGIKSQLKYEYEKKAAADSVRVMQERKVTDAQLKQEATRRYALSGGLVLVILFALFIVNRFRVTNKQKKIIEEQKDIVEQQKAVMEEKQREVLDSIHYARRIQQSLLPNEIYISKILNRKQK